MKAIRISLTLAILVIAGTICVIQQMELSHLKKAERELVAKHREISALYTALLETVDGKDAEIARLGNERAELLRLRNQVGQFQTAQKQLAAVQAENEALKQHEGLSEYLTVDQLRFAGFDSPESAFQSWQWADHHRDYDKWIATLCPQSQAEVIADQKSRAEFERERHQQSRIKGVQVLARKPIGHDRVELKVRLDTENSVAILIFPTVAVGNEWKLGDDDIQSYTEAWDK